jgi:glycosyltransferase involved in cell wall biosynthesis
LYALGTVQFGLSYGVANQSGRISSAEARAILFQASEYGFDTLDTAIAYGDSERVLGDLGINRWRVVTKLPSVPESCGDVVSWVQDEIRQSALRGALLKTGVDNVELLPPMKREQLIEAYQAADVLFLHLNDYDAFKKVLPSKLFEYGALGKPIWAGVSGYAAEFVHSELDNSAVFHPCDSAEAERVFAQLRLHDVSRVRFEAKFARKNIANELANDVLKIIDLILNKKN